MIVTVSPSVIDGAIPMPPSKSSMQRACAAALLTPGTTTLVNFGQSNDEKAALGIIKSLGADVVLENHAIKVTSNSRIFARSANEPVTISCGESGLSMRMFAPIASLFPFDITFTGEGSILQRPMDFFGKVLPQLGVQTKLNGSFLPLSLKGPLQPKSVEIDGLLSSQFLTGLLFAFAHAASEPVEIKVVDLKSKPYIDLTLDVLGRFGFTVENHNYDSFVISKRSFIPESGFTYSVEGDWSNAAFLLVAAAVAGEISLKNTDINSTQGDKKILEALKAAGAKLEISENEIHLANARLTGFEFDATHCPDLFPPLVALAVNCQGRTTIRGVNRLLHKESNRAYTLKEEFTKLGASIDYEEDVMTIEGGKKLKGTKVSSHNDHRIAMAAAVAALTAEGEVTVTGAEAVNKSYPAFYDDLSKIGARIDTIQPA